MTTTASKSGLRAKAEANRSKHAQRTPLPPRDLAAKREAAAEAIAEFLHKPGKGTVAQTEGETLTVKSRKGKAAKEEAPQDKAARYAGELSALGWKSEVTRTDGLHRLVAQRGNETLFLEWLKEAHVSGTSTYTIADRTVKVRNPAEAMRIAARKPEEAKAAQTRVSSNKMFRKRPTGPTVRSVPFDPETASDEEIITNLEGRQVAWHNQYRVESETATVGRATSIQVSRHARGHRIVSFVDPHFGFRAFRLDNLENVGRRANLGRIEQEVVAAKVKAVKASKAA